MIEVARRVRRHGLFYALACVTLGVSIGSSVLIVVLADAMWAQQRPLRDARHLVAFMRDTQGADGFAMTTAGLTEIAEVLGLEDIAGQVVNSDRLSGIVPTLRLDGRAGVVETEAVTANYFALLGIRVIGRPAADSGIEPDAVISDRLWREHFGANPDIIGSTSAENVSAVGSSPRSASSFRFKG